MEDTKLKIERTRFLRISCTAVAMAALSSPAFAHELVSGWEGTPSSGYGFVSPAFTFSLSKTHAVLVKPTVGYLYYNYREAGGVTTVTAPELTLEVGYRYTSPRLTVSVGPLLEVIWKTKAPALGPRTERTLIGAAAAGDIYYQATPLTALSLGANYDNVNRYAWARAGVKRRITDPTFSAPWALLIGAEVTDQGNKDLSQYGGGGLVEIAFDKGQSSVQIRGGYSWLSFSDHSTDSRPYVGVGLYHHF